MKKLIRLLSLISVLLIFVYLFNFVSECNQLKNTFGAFLVFNDSSSYQQCGLVNQTLQYDDENVDFVDTPLPYWSKIGDVYMYSAFWNSKRSFALAIGAGESSSDFSEFTCHVWFDLRNIIHSVFGVLKIHKTPSQSDSLLSSYQLTCNINHEEIKGKPYMFVLILTDSSNNVKKLFLPLLSHNANLITSNKTALCMLPDRVGTGKSAVIEFISYHQLVGLTDLIVYGGEVNIGILNKVKRLTNAKGFLRTLDILPWNFPFDNKLLEIQLIETDCLLRTHELTQAFGILEWDQYIVPKLAKQILSLLSLSEVNNNVNFLFKSEICCLEQKSDKRAESSWPIVLQKTQCADFSFYSLFKIIGTDALTATEVNSNYSSQVSVKTYRSCLSLKDINPRYDHSPLKFWRGLLGSNLLRLWNGAKLF